MEVWTILNGWDSVKESISDSDFRGGNPEYRSKLDSNSSGTVLITCVGDVCG